MKCECGGEIKPIEGLFKQSAEYPKFKKELEEMGCPEIKGYNCIECGQCYDENLERMSIRLGWLLAK